MVYNNDLKQFIDNPQLNVEAIRPRLKKTKRDRVMRPEKDPTQVNTSAYVDLEDIIDLGPNILQEENTVEEDNSDPMWCDNSQDSLYPSEATFYRDTLTPNQRHVLFNDVPQIRDIEDFEGLPLYFESNPPPPLYHPESDTAHRNLFRETIDDTARTIFGGPDFTKQRPESTETTKSGSTSHNNPPTTLRGLCSPKSPSQHASTYTASGRETNTNTFTQDQEDNRRISLHGNNPGTPNTRQEYQAWTGGNHTGRELPRGAVGAWRFGLNIGGRPTSTNARNKAMGQNDEPGIGRSAPIPQQSAERTTKKEISTHEAGREDTESTTDTKTFLEPYDPGGKGAQEKPAELFRRLEKDQRREAYATRARPDSANAPYLSVWFAKPTGRNEPAELRVLANRWITDAHEVQRQIQNNIVEPAMVNELERRKQFLSRELQRTGARYPGFPP